MSFETAVELTPDFDRLTEYVQATSRNGIVGDIRNVHRVDAVVMFKKMLAVARQDVAALLAGGAAGWEQAPGTDAWGNRPQQ